MKNSKKWKRFFRILPIFALGVFSFCSREKSIALAAYEKEKNGNLSEALYDYHRAVSINPDYGFANKRLGFLLSESQFSSIVAIHHLEKAFAADSTDMEVCLKLLDLTLFVGDFAKFKKLFTDSKNLIPEDSRLYLETLETCLSSSKDQAKALGKIETLESPPELKYYYRSLSFCYEKNGQTERAEGIANEFKKMNRAK